MKFINTKNILIVSFIGFAYYVYRVKIKEDIINEIYAKYPMKDASDRLILRRFDNNKLRKILRHEIVDY
jgi:hypothetical protein